MKREVISILSELFTEAEIIGRKFEKDFRLVGINGHNAAAFAKDRTAAIVAAAEEIEAVYALGPDPFDRTNETAEEKRERDADIKGEADMDKQRAGD